MNFHDLTSRIEEVKNKKSHLKERMTDIQEIDAHIDELSRESVALSVRMKQCIKEKISMESNNKISSAQFNAETTYLIQTSHSLYSDLLDFNQNCRARHLFDSIIEIPPFLKATTIEDFFRDSDHNNDMSPNKKSEILIWLTHK